MKKLLLVASLALCLFVMVFAIAGAGADFEDPKLCVAGQWLLVDAAHPFAVTVTLPEGVAYGDQVAGGCATAGPNVPQVQVVVERGNRSQMQVKVDGASATQPVVASYGNDTQVKKNGSGKGTMTFLFALP